MAMYVESAYSESGYSEGDREGESSCRVLNLESRLRESEDRLYNRVVATLNPKFKELESSISTLSSRVEKLDENLSSVKVEVDSLSSEISNLGSLVDSKSYLKESSFYNFFNNAKNFSSIDSLLHNKLNLLLHNGYNSILDRVDSFVDITSNILEHLPEFNYSLEQSKWFKSSDGEYFTPIYENESLRFYFQTYQGKSTNFKVAIQDRVSFSTLFSKTIEYSQKRAIIFGSYCYIGFSFGISYIFPKSFLISHLVAKNYLSSETLNSITSMNSITDRLNLLDEIYDRLFGIYLKNSLLLEFSGDMENLPNLDSTNSHSLTYGAIGRFESDFFSSSPDKNGTISTDFDFRDRRVTYSFRLKIKEHFSHYMFIAGRAINTLSSSNYSFFLSIYNSRVSIVNSPLIDAPTLELNRYYDILVSVEHSSGDYSWFLDRKFMGSSKNSNFCKTDAGTDLNLLGFIDFDATYSKSIFLSSFSIYDGYSDSLVGIYSLIDDLKFIDSRVNSNSKELEVIGSRVEDLDNSTELNSIEQKIDRVKSGVESLNDSVLDIDTSVNLTPITDGLKSLESRVETIKNNIDFTSISTQLEKIENSILSIDTSVDFTPVLEILSNLESNSFYHFFKSQLLNSFNLKIDFKILNRIESVVDVTDLIYQTFPEFNISSIEHRVKYGYDYYYLYELDYSRGVYFRYYSNSVTFRIETQDSNTLTHQNYSLDSNSAFLIDETIYYPTLYGDSFTIYRFPIFTLLYFADSLSKSIFSTLSNVENSMPIFLAPNSYSQEYSNYIVSDITAFNNPTLSTKEIALIDEFCTFYRLDLIGRELELLEGRYSVNLGNRSCQINFDFDSSGSSNVLNGSFEYLIDGEVVEFYTHLEGIDLDFGVLIEFSDLYLRVKPSSSENRDTLISIFNIKGSSRYISLESIDNRFYYNSLSKSLKELDFSNLEQSIKSSIISNSVKSYLESISTEAAWIYRNSGAKSYLPYSIFDENLHILSVTPSNEESKIYLDILDIESLILFAHSFPIFYVEIDISSLLFISNEYHSFDTLIFRLNYLKDIDRFSYNMASNPVFNTIEELIDSRGNFKKVYYRDNRILFFNFDFSSRELSIYTSGSETSHSEVESLNGSLGTYRDGTLLDVVDYGSNWRVLCSFSSYFGNNLNTNIYQLYREGRTIYVPHSFVSADV